FFPPPPPPPHEDEDPPPREAPSPRAYLRGMNRPCRALVVALAVGCAPATSRIVRPAVEAGVEEATERDVAKEIEHLLSTPEMQDSLEKLAKALLDGAHAELSQPEWQALIRARSADLVDGMAPALARRLATDIGPAMRRELVLAVQLALTEMAAPGSQAKLADVARAVTTAVTETMLASAADRPPLRVATEHVMLGMGDALEGEFGAALHGWLRVEREAVFTEVSRSAEPLRWALNLAVLVLGPAALALGLLFWRSRRAARRHDLAARLLARAADRAALDALVERLEVEGNAELARYLRRVAGRR
ncbi:MAG: hypothetical protein ACK4YP_18885, partial [Myxococcota bacterium]